MFIVGITAFFIGAISLMLHRYIKSRDTIESLKKNIEDAVIENTLIIPQKLNTQSRIPESIVRLQSKKQI